MVKKTSRRRGSWVVVAAAVVVLFASLAASCNPPKITVSYSKAPARGTTTVTVTVTGATVTQTTVRLDSTGASPIATSSSASFQFDLDTTTLLDGVHKLFVSSQTSSRTISDQFSFTVDNSPTVLPPGFQQSTAFKGLTQPVSVRFASDGRVFVAEKAGLIKVFASLTATTPTVFADLRTKVYSAYDHGLLGMALDPSFPTKPYIYVLYTLDAPIGGTPPVWNDNCPTPPGASIDGCVVSGRLSRLTASGNVMTGPEKVLITDWCQQFTTHSIGSVVFGADGALYASAGDGAGYVHSDYGQSGNPKNPCGDPPVPVGGTQTAPTAEGGALRSQDLLTSGDPVTLDGTIIRVDPATGAAKSDNANAANPDLNARRIIAFGLRNPYRITVRPGTNDLFIGDVGTVTWEEIDRVTDPTAAPRNFGWPCYEGNNPQPGYAALGLDICNSLYQTVNVRPPFFKYRHSDSVVAGDGCQTGGSSVSGGAFYPASGGTYPSKYNGALFFADYSRRCIWVMLKSANGVPDPTKVEAFATGTAGGVQPGRPRVRPGWRPLLRRSGGRNDPSHPLLRGQPAAGRRSQRQPGERRRAVDRELRCTRIDRRRRRSADVFVGPRRRRHVRRFQLSEPVVHLLDGGGAHRFGAGLRSARRPRRRDDLDLRGQHAANARHQHADAAVHVARRRDDQLLRLGERRAGRASA